MIKQKNLHKSVWRPLIKKIRPLYFLQLLKFQEKKWSYFFDWRPTDRDITVLSFHNILSQNYQISTPYHWWPIHITNIHRYFEITLIIIFIDLYKYMLCVYDTTSRVLKFGYFETKYHEMTNQLYIGLWASNKKNKTT